MQPRVKFIVPSYEQVAKKVYDTIKELGKDYKAIVFVKLPNYLVVEALNKKFDDVKEGLIREIKKYHNIEELEKTKNKLEQVWNKFNDIYFENIKKITGFDFKYNEYIVYFTDIVRGSYEGGTNQVYVDFHINYERTSFIICEEIFHLHYWEIYKKIVKNTKYPWVDKDIWEISETIPDFIFLNQLFNEFEWFEGLHRNYSFISERKKMLQPIWDNKKDFKDFMIKIHEELF